MMVCRFGPILAEEDKLLRYKAKESNGRNGTLSYFVTVDFLNNSVYKIVGLHWQFHVVCWKSCTDKYLQELSFVGLYVQNGLSGRICLRYFDIVNQFANVVLCLFCLFLNCVYTLVLKPFSMQCFPLEIKLFNFGRLVVLHFFIIKMLQLKILYFLMNPYFDLYVFIGIWIDIIWVINIFG